MVKGITGTTVEWLPLVTALPTIVSALIGTFCLAGFIEGYVIKKCKIWERALLLVAALSLLSPGLKTDIIGLSALILVFVVQKFIRKEAVA